MDETAVEQLKRGAAEIGIDLTEEQVGQFVRYAVLLEEWNTRMNLTRVPLEDVVPLHFLDSLLVLKAIELPPGARIVDVGTGAGFPGLPLKIAFSSSSVTLLDSTRKRLAFLEAVISELKLKGVATLHARAEEAGQDRSHRERYEVVTARAVARLAILAEWLLPLVKVGGVALALKSAGVDEEVEEASSSVSKLGGTIEKVVPLRIPATDIERKIVVIRKEKPTPPRYPRSAAEIKTSPLR